MERRTRAPATALALAVVAVLFTARFSAFLLGGTLYRRDAGFFFGPWRSLYPKLAAEGFPFWNDVLSNGRAYAANPNAAVFWPLSPLLFVVTPTALALVNLALLLVLFFFGLRAARLGPPAAAAGTAVLLFSGVLQSLPFYGGISAAAAPLVPAALCFWAIGGGESGRGRFAALGAVALALSALGGEPAVTAAGGLTCCALAGLGLVRGRPRPAAPEAGRRLVAVFGSLLLAAGLSAVQLLPAARELSRSARGTALSAEHGALFWSVRPSRLLTLLEPRLTGDPNSEEPTDYWGAGTFDAGQPYFPDLALGIVPLALAVAALPDTRGRAALGVAAGAAFLSFGRFLPGYAALASPLSIFRYPEKWWVVATLALSGAAAMGVERLLSADPEERAGALAVLRRTLVLLGAALSGLALLALLSPPALRAVLWTMSLGAGPVPAEKVAVGLLPLLLAGAASVLLAAGVAELVRRGRAPRTALLVALLVLFLADAARRVSGTLPSGPRDLFTRRPAAVELVAANLAGGRFFDDGADDRTTAERRNLETGGLDPLRAATGVVFGIPYALENDIDRMTSAAAVGAAFEAQRLEWGETKAARLREAGVSVARTAANSPDPPGVAELGRFGGDRIVGISPTRLEFLFVAEAVLAPNALAVRRLLAAPPRDPLRSAVIEVPGAPEGPRTGGRGAAKVRGRTGRRVTLDVSAGSPGGVLVMTRAFSPDWRALLDGHPLPVFCADGFLSAAFVPAGDHVLELSYDVAPFVRGLAVSVVSAAAVLALILRRRRS
jgi:hypothetical protein